jgi:hypothetical protein
MSNTSVHRNEREIDNYLFLFCPNDRMSLFSPSRDILGNRVQLDKGSTAPHPVSATLAPRAAWAVAYSAFNCAI